MNQEFVKVWKQASQEVHKTAIEKGWWNARNVVVNLCRYIGDKISKAAIANIQIAALGLVMTEICEGIENIRRNQEPDDKIPEFFGIEAELADAVIRIMDLSEQYGWRVAEAIVAKAEVNKGREKMHGGKLA